MKAALHNNFWQWVCGTHAQATTHAEKLRLYDADILKLHTPFGCVEKIIVATNKQFNTMFDGSHWSPATTLKSPEGPLPAGFQAAVEKCVKSAIDKAG